MVIRVYEWVCSKKQFVLIVSALSLHHHTFNYLIPLQCKQRTAVDVVAETWINRKNEIKWEILKKVKMKVCVFIFINMQRRSTNCWLCIENRFARLYADDCGIWICVRANKAKQSPLRSATKKAIKATTCDIFFWCRCCYCRSFHSFVFHSIGVIVCGGVILLKYFSFVVEVENIDSFVLFNSLSLSSIFSL